MAGSAPDRDGTRLTRRLDPYVPHVVLRHLVGRPGAAVHTLDATLLFTDISGFTKLSERLARRGREGAEELVEAIGTSLSALLGVAHADGGNLLKLSGDALLLLFEGDGHLARASRSALGMRRMLRDVGRLETSAGKVTLRMSQGLHSGEFHLFLVGSSHRELLIAGRGSTLVTLMEKAADAGEVVVSPETAALLPADCVGAAKGPGRLLTGIPAAGAAPPLPERGLPDADQLAAALSTEVRAHVLAEHRAPEHRHATAAFIRFEGTDAIIAGEGPEAGAAALHELVDAVQRAADEHQVCFLESDVDVDGGKLMMVAGAPRMVGDDEERMLLAMRRVIEGERRLPVRIGVNRGTVFSGDVGPLSRRSYSVMGDAVNLAARVMAKAPPGAIYATAGVLDRSATRFATERLEPFTVKGKKHPVQAWSVGPAIGSRSREGVALRFPLVGRTGELALLDDAVASVGRGTGRLVQITGEPGIGKTRLMEEVRERAPGLTRLRATCEAYTTSTAYAAWRELLRPLIGTVGEDPDDVVIERLWAAVGTWDADLLPWVPLLALPFGADMPATRQVSELAPPFRRARLHDVVLRFLRDRLREPTLIEIEDAHLMDAASADLLGGIAEHVGGEPWLVVVARRDTGAGFRALPGPAVTHVEPGPLGELEALALAEAVTDDDPLPPHVLRLAAERSGGNPQFLRDLLRAVASDRDAPLPDSIETAATARIDRLEDADRALVRRAAILGLSFHPRFLPEVLEGLVEPPDSATWGRLSTLFVDDGDGYLRFRRAVVRDAAYAGLPFAVRRRLHARVGERLEADAGPAADELAAILTVHFARARDHARVWRYARLAGHSAHERLAYADAAQLYRHALDAGRAVEAPPEQLARVHEALADAQARTGELVQAHEALRAARRLVEGDPLREAGLVLRHAQLSERAGHVVPARALDPSGPAGAGGARRRRAGAQPRPAAVAPGHGPPARGPHGRRHRPVPAGHRRGGAVGRGRRPRARVLHPRLGAVRLGPAGGGDALRARARDLRAAGRPRPPGGRAEQPRRLRVPRGPLGRRRGAVPAQPRRQRASR